MMLYEVELKARITDVEIMAEKLLKMGCIFSHTEKNSDIYYNHPARDFAQTDEAFRIRSIDGKSFLTYKGPKIGRAAKSRIEREMGVDDFDTAVDIVTYLGFRETGRVVKTRDVYATGEIAICLDRVEGLGFFIEIEMTGSERESLEKEVNAFAKELGISEFESDSYLEMELKKKGK